MPPFREAEIEVLDTNDGRDLISEFERLSDIHKALGDNHGHTIVCQIFGHADHENRFFLTGRILKPEESKAFAEILKKG